MTTRRNKSSLLMMSLCLMAGVAGGVGDQAQARQPSNDPIASFNQRVAAGPGTKDASAVLFPKLALMAPPPELPLTLRGVSLMTASSPEWAAWEQWAKGQAQQDVLAALLTVSDPKSKHTLALPYGRDAVPAEWVKPGLYVELGKPPLLAAVVDGPEYLDALDDLMVLCSVEAERLATEKKNNECMKLLIAWVRFTRMAADRPFAVEKLKALQNMTFALERMLDIACQHPGLFTDKNCQEATRELDFRAMLPERILFPVGEREAAMQLLSLTIAERGEVKQESFGPVMGRLTSKGRPLNEFAQAAFWTDLGKQHGGWFDTKEQITKVFGDWDKRWGIPSIFDPFLRTPTDYSKMDRAKFSMVAHLTQGIEPELFDQRTLLITQLGGTRAALGVVGFRAAQGQWPPTLPSVQPRFTQALDNDPWYWEPTREVRDIYRYFVPMRDVKVAEREEPKPHVVEVFVSVDTVIEEMAKDANASSKPADQPAGDAAAVPAPAPAPAPTVDVRAELEKIFGAEAAGTLRDALAGGIPSSLWDASTGRLDLAGMKTFLKEQLGKIPMSPEAKKTTEKAVDDLPEPAIRLILVGLSASGSKPTGDSVKVELTDADFVVYSVGPNGRAEWATSVGEGGADIIVWPPLLTLERRAMSAGK